MASQQSESQSQLEYDIDEAVQQEEEEHFISLFEQDDTDDDSEDDDINDNNNNKKKKRNEVTNKFRWFHSLISLTQSYHLCDAIVLLYYRSCSSCRFTFL
mmetsp:Transcript_16436/g.17764  ORF Transcript_16436/g.17764 Transcript_16436/m.17764 type:complete len:100 (+) Transcript_16436:120-419(+)